MVTDTSEEVQNEALASVLSLASKETVEMAEASTPFITKVMLGARQRWIFWYVIKTFNGLIM